MSYLMIARFERDTERTQLLLRNTQAELLAQGSVYWAIDQLKNNLAQQKPNKLTDSIPLKSPVNTEAGFKVSSIIYDLQGLYNLNNLSKPTAQLDFIRLVQAINPKIGSEEAANIAKAITDWVSTGKDTPYDQYYAGLPTPYRSAHRFMLSATELALIKGMTPALYAALQPYVTALPVATQVNPMTASAPVLLTLDKSMTMEIANAIIATRQATPILSQDQFNEINQVKNNHITANIATSSSYFLVVTTVSIENQQLVLYTLLQRAGTSAQPVVTILMQSKGIW